MKGCSQAELSDQSFPAVGAWVGFGVWPLQRWVLLEGCFVCSQAGCSRVLRWALIPDEKSGRRWRGLSLGTGRRVSTREGGTGLSLRVSFEFFPLGVVGTSFFMEKMEIIKWMLQNILKLKKNSSHPESCLHLCLEDVTLEVIWENSRWRRRMQGLLWKLLLVSLPGERRRKVRRSSELGKRKVGGKSLTLLSMLMWSEGHGAGSLSDSRAFSKDWEISNSSGGQGGARRSGFSAERKNYCKITFLSPHWQYLT